MRTPAFLRHLLLLTLVAVPSPCQIFARESISQEEEEEDFSLDEALTLLNDSPWARQQTITRVIRGVGSGEYGEKEIFSRYYVRLLSADRIAAALRQARSYIEGSEAEDGSLFLFENPEIRRRYLVIGVAFRSNQPDLENEVENTLRAQTLDTLRNRAYLSTRSHPQLSVADYVPPVTPAIGALFLFPRFVDGDPVLLPNDESFAFELDLPGDAPELRITFPVTDEILSDLSESGEPGTGRSDRIEEVRPSHTLDLSSGRFAGLINQFPQQTVGKALHGSVYLFHRNDNFDARNFFDPVGEPLPEFKRNQFGVSANVELGPRLNVFGSYDGLRIIRGSTLLANVPTPAMKRGDFSDFASLADPLEIRDPLTGLPFPQNRIPQDRINSVSQGLLFLLPDPNRSGDDVRNFVNSEPLVENQDILTLRADVGLDETNQIAGVFEHVDRDGIRPGALPAFGEREVESGYEASLSYTRTFSSTTVATWRFEFDRNQELELPRDDRRDGLLGSLGIEGVAVEDPADEGYPSFELEGYPDFGDEGLPQTETRNRYSLEGDLTLAKGDHLVRFSADLGLRQVNDSRANSLERGEFEFSGIYSGDSFADFLLGRAESATRALGSSRQDLRSRRFRIGLSDEWRLHPQFTLTIGLGYNYFEPYWSIQKRISVFRPLLFEPPSSGGLEFLEEENGVTPVRSDWNDFSPRLGLAFRPFGSGRLVLRASYRLSYEPVPSFIFENYLGRNFPFFYRQSSQASVGSGGLPLSSPFLGETATELEVRDIVPDLRTPYEQSWNLSMENQLNDRWILEARFRTIRDLKKYRVIPGNVPLPGPGAIQPRRPHPEFGQFSIVTGGGSSLFYEAEFEIERRYVDGFSFDARFEWRRYFNDDFDGTPGNPRNLSAEWAPNEGFPSRRLRLNFIVELPVGAGQPIQGIPVVDQVFGGWRVSGIAEMTSGTPFTVILPGDLNNDGLGGDRPDRLASGKLASEFQSIDRWFDTEAFALPDPFSFGNSGRSILKGPPFHNWDMSLVRDFALVNDHKLQLRLAFFNAWNHTNFEQPNRVFGTRLFGVITGAERSRELEVALKYSF